jgi:stage V sporulation protein G
MRSPTVRVTSVKLVPAGHEHAANGRIRGYARIVLDGELVVNDLKVIEGPHGLFVAMPSKDVRDRCVHCGFRTAMRANFCSECGRGLSAGRAVDDPRCRDGRGRMSTRIDVAHPITTDLRREIESAVLDAYWLAIGEGQPESQSESATV